MVEIENNATPSAVFFLTAQWHQLIASAFDKVEININKNK